jgi:hypothetical protein
MKYLIIEKCGDVMFYSYGPLDECNESVNYWSVCGAYPCRNLASCIIYVASCIIYVASCIIYVVLVERGCIRFLIV